MRMKRRAGWALIIILALGLVAGCQAVNGTDLNQIMLFKMNVQSLQGTEKVSVHLSLKPDAGNNDIDAEERQMLDLFKDISVDITDFKQESRGISSLKGNFVYGKGTIPFQITVNENQITVLAEGMKKPFVIRSDGPGLSGEQGGMSPQFTTLLKSMGSHQQELVRKLAGYLIEKLPNPPKISVTPVEETIHNEKLSLNKVEAEIKGSEFTPLIQQLAQNILQDEQGFKQLIADVINNLPQGEKPSPLLENKSLAVEMVYGIARSMLEQMATGQGDRLQTKGLDENTRLRIVLFADKDNMVRKSEMNFVISPLPDQNAQENATEKAKLQEVRFDVTSEMWNINQPVKADVIPVADHSLQLGPQIKTYEVLQSIQPDSRLYTLLKNDLHITRKRIDLHLGDDTSATPNAGMPYVKEDTLMVPVRFVAERLEADVSWDGEKKRVTISDQASGTTMVLTIDSNTATVNGMEKTLQADAQIVEDTTYVPVRFVAETLGAQVGYDDETRTVTISRD